MSTREPFDKWIRDKHPIWFSHQIHDDTIRIEQLWEAFQAGHALGSQEACQPKPYHCTKCGGAGWAQRSTGEVVECDECDSCGL